MKLVLPLLLAAVLLGCSQAPVNQDAAAAGGTAGGCVHATRDYRHGATLCQAGTRFRCEEGVWNSTFSAC